MSIRTEIRLWQLLGLAGAAMFVFGLAQAVRHDFPDMWWGAPSTSILLVLTACVYWHRAERVPRFGPGRIGANRAADRAYSRTACPSGLPRHSRGQAVAPRPDEWDGFKKVSSWYRAGHKSRAAPKADDDPCEPADDEPAEWPG